jgi:hypothetical protein
LLAASLLGQQFDPEDGGGTFRRNVGGLLPHYEASHSTRYYSSLMDFAYLVFSVEVFPTNIFRYIFMPSVRDSCPAHLTLPHGLLQPPLIYFS